VGSAAELAEKAVAGSAVSGLGQVTAANLQAVNLRRQQGKDTPATRSSFPYSSACPPRCRGSPADPITFFFLRFVAGGWVAIQGIKLTSDGVSRIKSIVQKNSLLEKSYSLLPICIWNHWQLVVICKKEDNDMPFLMLLESLHMGEHTRIENELKNFLEIAYEGKGMRAVADEMKVIDLHVPKVPQQKGSTECGFMVLYFIFCFILAAPTSFGRNDYPSFLTADWFSREEYEKFREDLQGKIIHIDAQSASTSKKVKRDPTLLRSGHGLQSNERIPVNVNQLGQPLGEGGQLLKQFLGTVARMGDKLPIDCISWRVIPSSNKDDVWDYIQRKFDVPISLRDFVMKDLDQKWRSWKYDLRTKFFTPYQKRNNTLHEFKKRSETNKQNKSKHTLFHCAGSKSFANIYHEEFLKTGVTLDRGDLFIRTRMKKAGGPVNDESAAMIDKIRDIKLTQQSTTSSSIASVGDAYEQVMGRDRTGRIRGIGTGPTPKSLWGSRSSQKLRQDNESLKEKIEALKERMKKFESPGNNESSASVCHAQKKKDSLAGRRVRIINFSGEVVSSGILMSDDNDNVVMGKKLGGEYYEVNIFTYGLFSRRETYLLMVYVAVETHAYGLNCRRDIRYH
ncbi:hypothetical protein Taro_029277, partial [Colocasia esculenta]|nr:hypothetical protein [Colocasia esculenta]